MNVAFGDQKIQTAEAGRDVLRSSFLLFSFTDVLAGRWGREGKICFPGVGIFVPPRK